MFIAAVSCFQRLPKCLALQLKQQAELHTGQWVGCCSFAIRCSLIAAAAAKYISYITSTHRERNVLRTEMLSGSLPESPLPRSEMPVTNAVGALQVMPGHGLKLFEMSPHGCDFPSHNGIAPDGSASSLAANSASACAARKAAEETAEAYSCRHS
jgi:hypothetical protein